MDQKPFFLTCSHCLKNSVAVPFTYVEGMAITRLAEYFGFFMKPVGLGAYMLCSKWCKWRHGRASGIHKLLNFLFHKSNAYKE